MARVKWSEDEQPSAWGWLIAPVPNYLEPQHLGPVPLSEVEWVEFNMMRTVHRGHLVPDTTIDVSAKLLENLQRFRFMTDVTTNIARVYTNPV